MVRVGCDADGNLLEDRFTEPMPWIGVYVAAASGLCGLAMGSDLIYGFRLSKLWFPNRLFSLNATILTLLGVAVKLSVDLNTPMPNSKDQLAKLSSSAFVCTVICNSMPSLGIMTTNDLIMNMMALGILVVTVVVNVSIQLATGAVFVFLIEHVVILVLMLFMFMLSSSSALTVTTTKQILESQFRKREEAMMEITSWNDDETMVRLKNQSTKFWMMAYTSMPLFVMARSVTCTASGFLCLLSTFTFAQALLRTYLIPGSARFCNGDSDYKWSTLLVLVSQTSALGVGTIAPAIRWFTAINFRCPKAGKLQPVKEAKVENYWIRTLEESKDSPLSIGVRNHRVRKLAQDLKRLILDLCIAAQCGIVMGSKVLRLVSIYFVSKILFCHALFKRLQIINRFSSSNESGKVSYSGSKPNLSRFVLHLEGEDALVEVMMERNRDAADLCMEMGRKKQPKHLQQLLEMKPVSDGFRRIKDFNSDQLPSLHQTEEPQNSWALSLATDKHRPCAS